MMMKGKQWQLLAAGAVFSLGAVSVSHACTLSAWDADGGMIVAGGPADTNNSDVARFSGLCAAQVTDMGWVQDNTPDGLDRIRASFYVRVDGSGDAVVYQGFGDENGGSAAFDVTISSNDVNFNTGGDVLTATVEDASMWNQIEIDWTASGASSLWVNADATTDPADATGTAGAGSIESVRLGLNGSTFTGTAQVDVYASRRTTPEGSALACDANGDGAFGIPDAVALLREIVGPPADAAVGQPDCDRDGGVGITDVVFALNQLTS